MAVDLVPGANRKHLFHAQRADQRRSIVYSLFIVAPNLSRVFVAIPPEQYTIQLRVAVRMVQVPV